MLGEILDDIFGDILGELLGVVLYVLLLVLAAVLFPFEMAGSHLNGSWKLVRNGYRGEGVRIAVRRSVVEVVALLVLCSLLYFFVGKSVLFVVIRKIMQLAKSATDVYDAGYDTKAHTFSTNYSSATPIAV